MSECKVETATQTPSCKVLTHQHSTLLMSMNGDPRDPRKSRHSMPFDDNLGLWTFTTGAGVSTENQAWEWLGPARPREKNHQSLQKVW